MKTFLAFLVVALWASNAVAQQPVKVRVFTSPDDAGFVTAESKQRQAFLKEVLKKLSKEKEAKRAILLADDAAVTIELISIERKTTGASETRTSALGVALQTPSLKETSLIMETTVTAILRFGDFKKELVSKRRTNESGDDQLRFKNLVVDFVTDNAAKLR